MFYFVIKLKFVCNNYLSFLFEISTLTLYVSLSVLGKYETRNSCHGIRRNESKLFLLRNLFVTFNFTTQASRYAVWIYLNFFDVVYSKILSELKMRWLKFQTFSYKHDLAA